MLNFYDSCEKYVDGFSMRLGTKIFHLGKVKYVTMEYGIIKYLALIKTI